MAVPKRKTSKHKKRLRRGAHKIHLAAAKACPNCGAPQLPHRICPSCGYYRGKQVLTIRAK
ncbi:MAG: 50S ribosomal protein L32 [Lentisphaerae bacterium]|nr:50S ribosomal protein L32 [Lentisphaerota bacterium]